MSFIYVLAKLIFLAVTPVFSTWSFRNDCNVLICCSWKICWNIHGTMFFLVSMSALF